MRIVGDRLPCHHVRAVRQRGHLGGEHGTRVVLGDGAEGDGGAVGGHQSDRIVHLVHTFVEGERDGGGRIGEHCVGRRARILQRGMCRHGACSTEHTDQRCHESRQQRRQGERDAAIHGAGDSAHLASLIWLHSSGFTLAKGVTQFSAGAGDPRSNGAHCTLEHQRRIVVAEAEFLGEHECRAPIGVDVFE